MFRPVPNVDSALVRMRRIAPAPNDELAALVQDAFAHRRKALPRSLEEAGGPAGIREAAREALEDMGHPRRRAGRDAQPRRTSHSSNAS